jgi:hypothetical protein
MTAGTKIRPDHTTRTPTAKDGEGRRAMYALCQVNVHELMLAHYRDVWVKAYGLLLCSDVDAQQDPLLQGN